MGICVSGRENDPVRHRRWNSFSSTQANFDGTFPYGGGASGPYIKRTWFVGSYTPNAWVFATCMEMCGNGVRTGMAPIQGQGYRSQRTRDGLRARAPRRRLHQHGSGLPIRQARQPRAKLPPSHPGFSRWSWPWIREPISDGASPDADGRTVARLSVRCDFSPGGRRVLAGGRGQWVTPLAQDSWPQDWLDAIHGCSRCSGLSSSESFLVICAHFL